jgi:hypothetical protein
MEQLNITDYLNAPAGDGPLAQEWKDKPHRLIYDLISEIIKLRKEQKSDRTRG